MSGILGIVSFDGRPVDAGLLDSLTGKMSAWAPDGTARAVEGDAGLGFARLGATEESARERQPFSLDGVVHVVADARVDDRDRLLSELATENRTVPRDAPDVELILHAYLAWGCRCVDRLIGDFSFAIWNTESRELFCARDHFGVKPFYYADLGGTFVFCNSLNVVRMHPGVGEELDELAIADFLLFGFNQSLDTTSFKSICRLPPAHLLRRTVRQPAVIERYWTLPREDSVRYRKQWEYVEHFRDLFRTSVADRVRGSSIGVSMSGGLDSTSVAAMAHSILSDRVQPFDLRLYTNVYDRLIPDEERHFASEMARVLDASIHFEPMDDAKLNAGWNRPGIQLPEPFEDFNADTSSADHTFFTANCPAVLSGLGGDPLLASPSAYVVNRVLHGRWRELADGLWQCWRTHRRLPSLGLRSRLPRRRRRSTNRLRMPAWLNHELVRRLDLDGRWKAVMARAPDRHPVRPEAYTALDDVAWQHCFGALDPGCSGLPVEHRHPFFDVRLVRFALAMPDQPWFVKKALLREAMIGVLPDEVRLRPKTPLRGDPAHSVAPEFDRRCRNRLLSNPALCKFVDKDAFPGHIWDAGVLAPGDYYGNVRALSLGYWLYYCWHGGSAVATRGDS